MRPTLSPPALALALLRAAGLALVLAGAAAAQSGLDSLPEGMDAYASTRSECFLPGEIAKLDAEIEASRQSLPGCASGVVPPEAEIEASRAYKQHSGSVIDCASMRKREENTRFLNAFLADVIATADGPKAAPACAAAMIGAWAEADAMRDIGAEGSENTARALRMFTLAGLSSAYLIHPEVRAAAKPAQDAAILAWFGRLSSGVEEDIARRRAQPREDNIQYWHGWAILPTALLRGDAELLGQSRRIFGVAMGAVTRDEPDPRNDGFLPLELGRGDKALSYQAYALQPILAMATLSQAYGCDFLASRKDADQLAALVTRTLEGYEDPAIFAQAAVRLGMRKKPAKQQRGSAGRAPDLVYLVNRLDPALYDRIDGAVSEATGKPQPVFPPGRGAKESIDRLGGSLRTLANQSAALAKQPAPKGLARACGG